MLPVVAPALLLLAPALLLLAPALLLLAPALLLLAPALLLLALTAPGQERLVGERSQGQGPKLLRVVIECTDCDPGVLPSLVLLWRGAASPGLEEGTRQVVATRDWGAGSFDLVTDEGSSRLESSPAEEGWIVDIPLGAEGLPLRLTASLTAHVATPGALWPSEQLQLLARVSFEPVEAFLDRHPEWDPARTDDCLLVVPSGREPPHVIAAQGEPRAWVFPTPGARGPPPDGPWTLQFVRPGGTLLERVSVPIEARPDGEGLAFRVPLLALRSAAADALGVLPEAVPLDLRGAGDLDPRDCPRRPHPGPGPAP